MSDYIIPLFIAMIIIFGCFKKVDIFDEFTYGAGESIKTVFEILPALIAMIGFPKECLPLAIIRPISGSGALAVYESILSDVHPDSFAGRVASVILGSTETTFYTIAVYYGAVKIKNTRHSLAAALSADLAGFIFSVLTVRLLMTRDSRTV